VRIAALLALLALPPRTGAPAVAARVGLAAAPQARRDGAQVVVGSGALAALRSLLGERARRARIASLEELRAHFGR
jgi:hypothetical protein